MTREDLLLNTEFGKLLTEHKLESIKKYGTLDFEETLRVKEQIKRERKYIVVKREEYISNFNALVDERDFLLDYIAENMEG